MSGDDIVDRLRSPSLGMTPIIEAMTEAADEIKRLRAERDALRSLLAEAADYIDPRVASYTDLRLRIKDAVRRALEADDAE